MEQLLVEGSLVFMTGLKFLDLFSNSYDIFMGTMSFIVV